ncbi:MAG: FtsX-like permease family protein [Deinococcota bacterium]
MDTTARQLSRPANPVRKAASTSPLNRLAWRNVWRQKRRTTLLIIVVAYATASIIFFWGFTEGFSRSIITNQARIFSAPAMVMTPAYFTDPDPENALSSLDVLDDIRNTRGVNALTLRLEFAALLRSPYTSQGATVRGIDPASEGLVSTVPSYLTEGRMIEAPGEVVMGKELAADLDVRLGERLAVDVSSTAGPQGAGLILVGLLDSGIAFVDESTILVHIDDARSLTGVDTATGIALDVPRGQEAAVATRLQEVLPADIQAFEIMDLLGPLRIEVEQNRVSMIPLGLLFAIFAALAVTSTVLVSVIERTREFGMMAAIGFSPPRLARMVVLEASLATVSGWLVGVLIGFGLNALFANVNILGPVFEATFDSFAQFGFSDEFYTSFDVIYALYAAVTVVFAGIFALLIPARKVATINPAEAMRAD